jgi:hypothetical protein
MIAHFFADGPAWKRRWRFSGHQACGDEFDGAGDRRRKEIPPRAFDAIVDVGRDFILTSDKDCKLYITGPGPHQFTEHSPEGVILAAKLGMFGFKFVKSPF